ncbi:hypothetical protein MPTK1_7g17550 [Marchantia polymorpha subsp. ruderalis]
MLEAGYQIMSDCTMCSITTDFLGVIRFGVMRATTSNHPFCITNLLTPHGKRRKKTDLAG